MWRHSVGLGGCLEEETLRTGGLTAGGCNVKFCREDECDDRESEDSDAKDKPHTHNKRPPSMVPPGHLAAEAQGSTHAVKTLCERACWQFALSSSREGQCCFASATVNNPV